MDEKELDEEIKQLNNLKYLREDLSKTLRMLIDNELISTEEKYIRASNLLNSIYSFDCKRDEHIQKFPK